jgi:hypothetical protein
MEWANGLAATAAAAVGTDRSGRIGLVDLGVRARTGGSGRPSTVHATGGKRWWRYRYGAVAWFRSPAFSDSVWCGALARVRFGS